MAASTAAALPPAVPKAKPKPRVPSPTPEPLAVTPIDTPVSAPATRETAAGSATLAPGRHAGSPAAPLRIATELLAAFDGDFSKAVECLLTAHKFA